MQKHIGFILLLRVKYIFSSFSGCNHACLEMFCIIKSYIFYQIDKIKFFIFYCEYIVRVSLIVKDSVIIFETIKWVFDTTLFGSGLYPFRTIFDT